MAVDWVAIGTVALAIATSVLAYFTYRTVNYQRRLRNIENHQIKSKKCFS